MTQLLRDAQTGSSMNYSRNYVKILVSERRYKEEVALAVKEGALLLLNCPSAIQRPPTLDERKAQIKFEVASKSVKHGRVELSVAKFQGR